MKIVSYNSDKLWELEKIVVPKEIPSRVFERLHHTHATILQSLKTFESHAPEEFELVAVIGIKKNTRRDEYWQCTDNANRVDLEVGMLHLCRSWIQVWLCTAGGGEQHFAYKLTELFVGKMHGCILNPMENGYIEEYLREMIQWGRDACLRQSSTVREKHFAALDAEKMRVRAIFPIQA